MRILLVEDDENLGGHLANRLAELGLEVDYVREGEEALKLLKKRTYEAMVLDLSLNTLPMTQGLQVLQWTSSERPDTAVVAVTGHEHLAFRAQELGVDAFLRKPVDPGHVLQYLRRAIELRQLRRENARMLVANRRLRRAVQITASAYLPGFVMGLLFIAVLFVWRRSLPNDVTGPIVVAIISFLALVGSTRVSKLVLDFLGQKLQIETTTSSRDDP